MVFALYYLYLLVKLTLKSEETGKRNWWYILTYRGLLDLFILIFTYVSVGSSFELILDEDDLFDTSQYIDSQAYSTLY